MAQAAHAHVVGVNRLVCVIVGSSAGEGSARSARLKCRATEAQRHHLAPALPTTQPAGSLRLAETTGWAPRACCGRGWLHHLLPRRERLLRPVTLRAHQRQLRCAHGVVSHTRQRARRGQRHTGRPSARCAGRRCRHPRWVFAHALCTECLAAASAEVGAAVRVEERRWKPRADAAAATKGEFWVSCAAAAARSRSRRSDCSSCARRARRSV